MGSLLLVVAVLIVICCAAVYRDLGASELEELSYEAWESDNEFDSGVGEVLNAIIEELDDVEQWTLQIYEDISPQGLSESDVMVKELEEPEEPITEDLEIVGYSSSVESL